MEKNETNDGKHINVCQGRQGMTIKEYYESFAGVKKLFLIPVVVIVKYKCSKICKIVHAFQKVSFTIEEFFKLKKEKCELRYSCI